MAEATAAKVPEAAMAQSKAALSASAKPAKSGRDKLGLFVVLLNVINLAALAGTGIFLQRMWGKMREVNALGEKILAARVAREKAAEHPIGKEFEAKPIG